MSKETSEELIDRVLCIMRDIATLDEQRAELLRDRDANIRAAIASGVGMRELGRATGLTAGRISQIAAL